MRRKQSDSEVRFALLNLEQKIWLATQLTLSQHLFVER